MQIKQNTTKISQHVTKLVRGSVESLTWQNVLSRFQNEPVCCSFAAVRCCLDQEKWQSRSERSLLLCFPKLQS